MKVVITTFDMGDGFIRELDILTKMGLDAMFLPLEASHDPDQIIKTLHDADFVLAGVDLYSETVFQALKASLKLLARLGTGIEKVDIPAATRYGIAVSNTPGANASAVAQHTLALMLDVSLRISCQDRSMRNGTVQKRQLARDLLGKTVGLIGFGNISRQLIRLLSGFGVTIIVSDKHHDVESAKTLGVTLVDSLDELAAQSDFISLHIPLNEKTHHLIDSAFFKKMKTTAYLINTSRGPIINEQELIAALEQGTIAGAALDVFENYPLSSESPILKLPNTVLTPYVAYATELSNRQVMDMAIGSIDDYLNGRPIRNLRNPEYVKYR